jgi:hypothetical protein
MSKRVGPRGGYFRVDFDLGVSFGASGIEFRLLYQGRVMGQVEADYNY